MFWSGYRWVYVSEGVGVGVGVCVHLGIYLPTKLGV